LVQITVEGHLPKHQYEILKAAEESERGILRELIRAYPGAP
jgi:hypothetical protein